MHVLYIHTHTHQESRIYTHSMQLFGFFLGESEGLFALVGHWPDAPTRLAQCGEIKPLWKPCPAIFNI